jgi:hypothetical protein
VTESVPIGNFHHMERTADAEFLLRFLDIGNAMEAES